MNSCKLQIYERVLITTSQRFFFIRGFRGAILLVAFLDLFIFIRNEVFYYFNTFLAFFPVSAHFSSFLMLTFLQLNISCSLCLFCCFCLLHFSSLRISLQFTLYLSIQLLLFFLPMPLLFICSFVTSFFSLFVTLLSSPFLCRSPCPSLWLMPLSRRSINLLIYVELSCKCLVSIDTM